MAVESKRGMWMGKSASMVLARTPHPSPAAIATALSHAFLNATSWTAVDLTSAGATVLGARRRWLGPLVRTVLDSYRDRPDDAPRQLAASIAVSGPFRQAVAKARQQGRPLRIAVHHPGSPGIRAGNHRIPVIAGLGQLAQYLDLSPGELDWFADTGHWNRLARPGPLHHYGYVWRPRPGRTPRLLEVPGQRLKAVQRKVLDGLLAPIPVHSAAHGFVPGRSAASGAARHTGAEVVISLDLTSFFATVTAGKVYAALRRAGHPEAVAHKLTGLCTHVVPPGVIAAMPAGGTADGRFALAQALRMPHLPQGSPTSPALANVALRRLDARLEGWAATAGGTFTRYADDLSFSGGTHLLRQSQAFLRGAQGIIADEGFAVNETKTRIRPRSTRQQVTGIVVNSRINAPRADFEALKAVLHNCVLHGPDSQNRAQHPDFQGHLLGRIMWMEQLNPARGARLRRSYAQISW